MEAMEKSGSGKNSVFRKMAEGVLLFVMRLDRVKWNEKIRGSTKIEFIWAKLPMQLL